jgi:hypothetical protein
MCLCIVVVVGLVLPQKGFGQVPIQEEILESVTFLYPYSIVNGIIDAGAGTGFLVKQTNPKSQLFLVTAKHVLLQKSGKYYPKLCIRLGTKSGSDFIPIPLMGNRAVRILTHPTDSDVDIAVIPAMDILVPDGTTTETFLGTSLGTSIFATKEHFDKGHIRLGDEIFYTGWFSTYFGRKKNHPIVRFGRLSFLNDEKIPWRESGQYKMLDLYLIEAWATAGNSGSPVFFRPNIQREPKVFRIDTPTLLFAGILKGSLGAFPLHNAGIVAVVPAFQLETIISSDTAKQLKRLNNLTTPEQKDIDLCREVEKQFIVHSK